MNAYMLNFDEYNAAKILKSYMSPLAASIHSQDLAFYEAIKEVTSIIKCKKGL